MSAAAGQKHNCILHGARLPRVRGSKALEGFKELSKATGTFKSKALKGFKGFLKAF